MTTNQESNTTTTVFNPPDNNDCNPSEEAVLKAQKEVTLRRAQPGQCAACGRKFGKTHYELGAAMGVGINWPIFYCDRAIQLIQKLDEAPRGDAPKWMAECPMLYRRIKPGARNQFPRIDWERYDLVQKWDPNSRMGLAINGDSGAGKSTAIWHLMLRLERQGIRWHLLDPGALSKHYFESVRARAVDELVEKLVKVPVLALDDMGKSLTTEGMGAFVFDLINRRCEQLQPIVLTTRFTSQTLGERFPDDRTKGDDIARRINDYCTPIRFRLGGKGVK